LFSLGDLLGQAPESMNYQAVIRDGSGDLVASQSVGISIKLLKGNASGTNVYEETYAVTTDAYGLVNLQLGTGTVQSGTFSSIDWGDGPYFVETAGDVAGGTNYNVISTTQFMSVPYALYANKAGLDSAAIQGIVQNDVHNYIYDLQVSKIYPDSGLCNTDGYNSSPCLTYNNALIYCDTLTEGSFSDWFLPNLDQLSSVTSGGSIIPDFRTQDYMWTTTVSPTASNYLQSLKLAGTGNYVTRVQSHSAMRVSVRCIRKTNASSSSGSSSSNSGSNAQTLLYTSDGF
jgi:hypothetical protein